MKKILIPTDFSKTSLNAIKYAMYLMKYEKTKFIILHAYADEVYAIAKDLSREDFEELKKIYQKKVDKSLKKEIAEVLGISLNTKHSFTSISRFGGLVDETNEIVDKENIDLVVMGTKGKMNKSNITFGSKTLQVIKYVKCPVLSVPFGYYKKSLKKILFPSDYMLPFKYRELALVSNLALSFGATITFLYISDFKESLHRQLDNKSFLDQFFENNKCTFLQTPENGITNSINKIIKEDAIDLLVMVNQRHSYLEHILYNSTIEKIGLEIQIPFLVLQNLHR